MDFYEVIRTRRSIRSYRAEPIPQKILNKVLDAARIAPSGSNHQPWRFIMVKNETLKKQLVPACGNQSFIAEAPIVIVACGYELQRAGAQYNRGGYMGDMSMLVDLSIAFTHLILAARAEGLGTCWIGAFDNEEVKKILNIPREVNVVAITPLGYPKTGEFASVVNRKSLDEMSSTDKF